MAEIDRREFLKMMVAAPVIMSKTGTHQIGEKRVMNILFPTFPQVTQGRIEIFDIQQQVDCPIYMFHGESGNTVESVLYNNIRSGRRPITVSTLTKILLGEEGIPEQSVFCLTFDDGLANQYREAFQVLKKWWTPATFFVMGTGWQGDGVHQYMTHAQIQEIYQAGYEIGSHTVNHPPNLIFLRNANRGAYLAELFDSKRQLEELLQKPVETFAYTSGIYDEELKRDVNTQYRAAVSTRNRNSQVLQWLFELGRRRS